MPSTIARHGSINVAVIGHRRNPRRGARTNEGKLMARSKTVVRGMPDAYFELVRKFPLTRIRDDAHLDEAARVMDELLQRNLDSGGEAYLDALTDLVEVYENEHHDIPDVSEAELLRYLMVARELTQSALSRRTGIALSTVSAVL